MTTPDEDIIWYTPQEVAQLFRVDAKTVGRWYKRGKFDEYKVRIVRTPGGHNRFAKEDIDRVFSILNPTTDE